MPADRSCRLKGASWFWQWCKSGQFHLHAAFQCSVQSIACHLSNAPNEIISWMLVSHLWYSLQIWLKLTHHFPVDGAGIENLLLYVNVTTIQHFRGAEKRILEPVGQTSARWILLVEQEVQHSKVCWTHTCDKNIPCHNELNTNVHYHIITRRGFSLFQGWVQFLSSIEISGPSPATLLHERQPATDAHYSDSPARRCLDLGLIVVTFQEA